MADFKTHTSIGLLWGILCGLISVILGFCSIVNSVIILFLAILGSAMPDIDSNTGRPREIVLSFLGVLLPSLILIYWGKNMRMENLIVLLLAAFVVIRYPTAWIFSRFTVHRGAFHSVPVMIIFAELIYLLFNGSSMENRIIYSLTVLGAIFSHLILDEVYALDPLHISVKRSFGSALKLSLGSTPRSSFAYMLIFFLTILCFLTTDNHNVGFEIK